MTIRDVNNWCSTCQEACHDHATMCTVCGSTLEAPPQSSSSPLNNTSLRNNQNTSTTTNNGLGLRAMPEFMTDDLRQAGRDLNVLLSGLTNQVQELNASVEQVIQEATLLQQRAVQAGAAGALPADAMDPTQQARRSRPMSKKTLQNVPRIVVTPVSSLFHKATLDICDDKNDGNNESNETWNSIPTVLGELEWHPPSKGTSNDFSNVTSAVFELRNATLIIAEPRTGKGNTLSTACRERIQQATSKVLLYFDRGDGVTFAQKALLAQRAGAHAVVIGNNVAKPWPYVMQDTKGEIKAASIPLAIPVVMIPQNSGRNLVEKISSSSVSPPIANLTISATSHAGNPTTGSSSSSSSVDCIICQDAMEVTQTVMKLPDCGHIFHESCAMAWLKQQNTCPYCRHEYPTEDPTYDEERRRRERQRQNETPGIGGGSSDFYG